MGSVPAPTAALALVSVSSVGTPATAPSAARRALDSRTVMARPRAGMAPTAHPRAAGRPPGEAAAPRCISPVIRPRDAAVRTAVSLIRCSTATCARRHATPPPAPVPRRCTQRKHLRADSLWPRNGQWLVPWGLQCRRGTTRTKTGPASRKAMGVPPAISPERLWAAVTRTLPGANLPNSASSGTVAAQPRTGLVACVTCSALLALETAETRCVNPTVSPFVFP